MFTLFTCPFYQSTHEVSIYFVIQQIVDEWSGEKSARVFECSMKHIAYACIILFYMMNECVQSINVCSNYYS